MDGQRGSFCPGATLELFKRDSLVSRLHVGHLALPTLLQMLPFADDVVERNELLVLQVHSRFHLSLV
ncbi:MAG TPA: hypothetical protein VGF67_23010 [Ktedonobacteraceae bacterium]